ncbi:hypothetical protein SLS60_005664 [Paraconiothyrium brasiliense]|uniref:Uncharacterized protein n=1 Tax=Paraconiothyrium brasiliense TaxID=300254 RepID=A0ABR3RIA5_9PLEO
MTAAQTFTVLAGIVGVLALAVYLFGIPPELKRKLERSALKTMGENKLSYMAKGKHKPFHPTGAPSALRPASRCNTASAEAANHPADQISKIPASDQEDVNQLKKGLGNAVGGIANNPLGEATGETADSLTSPFTGR